MHIQDMMTEIMTVIIRPPPSTRVQSLGLLAPVLTTPEGDKAETGGSGMVVIAQKKK